MTSHDPTTEEWMACEDDLIDLEPDLIDLEPDTLDDPVVDKVNIPSSLKQFIVYEANKEKLCAAYMKFNKLCCKPMLISLLPIQGKRV